MKTCKECGETKPLNLFNKNKNRKDGYAHKCRACTQAYVVAHQQKRTVEAKVCTRCLLEKVAADFGVRRASPDGLQFKCKLCVTAEAAAYRLANPEAAKATNKRWYEKKGRENYQKNHDRILENARRYQAENRKLCRQRSAAWQAKNPDYGALKYARNKERLKPIRAKHYQDNKDDYMTRRRNKRARVRNAGTHTTKEVKELFARQDGRCANLFCGIVLVKGNKHLDHIVALSRGGSNTIENLQYLCAACNLSKFNRSEEVWYAEQARRFRCQ